MDGFWFLFNHFDWRIAVPYDYPVFALITLWIGLALKLPLVRSLLRPNWRTIVLTDLAMNGASLVVDLVAIPTAALLWGLLMDGAGMPQTGATRTGHVLVTAMTVALVRTQVERFGIRRVLHESFGGTSYWWLYCANLTSLLCGLAGVLLHLTQRRGI